MYYRGTLTIDPKELTKIQIEKPSGAFKSMCYKLTGGKIGDKKEIETFTAICMVEQIYSALSSIGISNMIRLNHDDLDIYHDKKGRKDDFQLAVDTYSIEIDHSMSSYFNKLWLVLEHEDDTFKYLIEASINRNHKVNDYPIEILVSGLLKQSAQKVNSKEDLKNKFSTTFQSQDEYNQFVSTKQIEFVDFLNTINFELSKSIGVDDIKQSVKTRMLIQRDKDKESKTKQEPKYGDAPYSYYGFGDFLFASILWSDLCFDYGLNIANTELIDGAGDLLADVGDTGIDAIDGSIFDSSVDLDSALNSLETGDMLSDTDFSGFGESLVDSGADGSWFDSIGDSIDIDF